MADQIRNKYSVTSGKAVSSPGKQLDKADNTADKYCKKCGAALTSKITLEKHYQLEHPKESYGEN